LNIYIELLKLQQEYSFNEMFHACPAIYWRMYIAAKIAKAYYGLLNWIKEKSY